MLLASWLGVMRRASARGGTMKILSFLLLALWLSSYPSPGVPPSPTVSSRGVPSLGTYQTEFLRTYVNKDPLLTLGYNELVAFNFEGAVALLRQAARADSPVEAQRKAPPSLRSEAWTYLGYAYTNLLKHREAHEAFQKALTLNPDNDLAYYFLANLYYIEGEKEKTKDALDKAIQRNPKFVAALRMLAETYSEEGDAQKAVAFYEQIVKLLPDSGYYGFQMYRAYTAAGKREKARDALLHLIDLEPKFLQNYYRLGDLYLEMGEITKARSTYQKMLELDRNFYLGYVGIGKVYFRQGLLDQARENFKKASALSPDASEVRQNVALLEKNEREILLERVKGGSVSAVVLVLLALLLWGAYLLKRRKEILGILSEFNQRQDQIYEVDEMLQFIFTFFMKAMGSTRGAILFHHRQNNQLSLAYQKEANLGEVKVVTGPEVTNWIMSHTRLLLTLGEAGRSQLFAQAFPSLLERLQEAKLRLLIPLAERQVLLALLVLDEGTKGRPHDLVETLGGTAARAIEALYLYESSMTDETTELYNKRYFKQFLSGELKRADRYSQPCSILAMDIDDFKKINDTYGHPQGDLVLKELALLLKSCIREGIDIPARTGGEEFHLILPATDMERARTVGERIRETARSHQFPGLPRPVTLSFGLATYPHHAQDELALIEVADEALYVAKRRGKNRICTADDVKGEAVEIPSQPFLSESLALFDRQTNLHTSAYFYQRLKDEIKRSIRYNFPCSLVLLGVGQGGEPSRGSEIAGRLGELIRDSLRIGIDTPAFLSQDLVGIIIPETEKERAGTLARRLLGLSSQLHAGAEKTITLSAGIATFPTDALTEEAFFKKSMSALEEARREGGGACRFWQSPASSAGGKDQAFVSQPVESDR